MCPIATSQEIIKELKPEYPIDLELIAKELKAKVIKLSDKDLKEAPIPHYNFSFYNYKSKTIFIKGSLNEKAYRLTLAHELGHHALKHKTHTERNETDAYTFAYELLMPKQLLKKDLKHCDELTFEKLTKISKKFNVLLETSAIWCTKVFHKPYAIKRVVAQSKADLKKLFLSEDYDPDKATNLLLSFKSNKSLPIKSNFFYCSRSFKGRFSNTYPIENLPVIEKAWNDKKDSSGYLDFGTPDYKKHYATCKYMKSSKSLLVLIKEE